MTKAWPDDVATGEEVGLIERLCEHAFGPGGATVTDVGDVNQGRGAFSVVLRTELAWSCKHPSEQRPASVVAKLPIAGPNGAAAIASGAYRREALAYRELLDHSPVSTPVAFAVRDLEDGSCALLLEDLTGHRRVDQLDGLESDDADRVAVGLGDFHHRWSAAGRTDGLTVRRNTIAGLGQEGLARGLACLDEVWSDDLSDTQRATFADLVRAKPALAELFDREPQTLCHGDPRADNLVFDADGAVVLFDWQQMAVQFGEADLAWLAATSIETDLRRRSDTRLVEAYGGTVDRYRLGLALPGLAVLYLAQRALTTDRTRRFVAVSLQRIADAVADFEVAALGN